MENDPYQKTFQSIILISQTPFYNGKSILIQLVLSKKYKTKYQSPSFSCGYSKVYCHITHVLEVWNIRM